MKSKFVLLFGALPALLALLLPPAPASAQPLSFDRVLACGNGDGNHNWGPTAQAFDAQGNQYVVGTFNGTIQLGNTLLTAVQTPANYIRPFDTFLAKLDGAGQYVWAIQFGDNQASFVNDLAVDGAGHLYVAGSFESFGLRLGGSTPVVYNSSAFSEAFVAQFNAATGQLQWARRAGGTLQDYCTKVVLNATGDIYIVCSSRSATVDFGTTFLPNQRTDSFGTSFLAKLNSAGAWQWARPVGDGATNVSNVVLDASGNLYLVGSFRDTATFGLVTLTSQVITGTPWPWGSDVFVTKTTDTGAWLWAVQGDAMSHQNFIGGSTMVLDNAGHLYLAGGYASTTARFGPTVLPNLSSRVPQGNPQGPVYPNYYYSDAFVARMNAGTGAWEWAARNGGPGNDGAGNPIIDAQGRFYVSGQWSGTGSWGQLGRIDPATGTWLSSQPLPAPGFIALDRQNRLNMAGSIGVTPTTFGTITLQPAGPTQGTGYLARLGAAPLAARSASGTAASLQVWPNPAGGGAVWVQGPDAGQPVRVLDLLGRLVAQGRMPAAGPLALSLALPAGVYVVQAEGQARRLVIE